MDAWYSKELGDGIMASMPSDEIERVFLRLFTTLGKPLDMAVFTRLESEGRLHCEVVAYFPLPPKISRWLLMRSPVKNLFGQDWACSQAIHFPGQNSFRKGIDHILAQNTAAGALQMVDRSFHHQKWHFHGCSSAGNMK